MADQDFNIKVITTADTTGLKQTRAEMEALRQQAEKIKQDAGAAALFARVPPGGTPPVPPGAGAGTGLTGTALGIGTIITLLTASISKVKQWNDEQDRMVESMLKAQAQMAALGEEILDMQDKARNAARVATEPLEQSFIRLQQEIIRVKTEMSGLLDAGEFEDWKKLNAELGVSQHQLDGVTSALQRQDAAAKKAAQTELEKRVPGLGAKPEIQEADAQTQRILQNEQAAATARAEGRDKDAEMFEKSAEQYKSSATPKQLADLQRIHDLQDKLKPTTSATPSRQPQPGEPGGGEEATGETKLTSEEMRQNQLNARAARYQGVQQTRQGSEDAQKSRESELAAMLDRVMAKYWGQ